MATILGKLKLNAAKLQGAVENIKQQLAQQGAQMEDMKIKQSYVLPHFDLAFKTSQQEILEERDFDEEELEDAVTYYSNKGQGKLSDIVYQIKVLYKEFGGDVDISSYQSSNDKVNASNDSESKEISLEEIVNLLDLLGERVNEITDQYCASFIKLNGIILPNYISSLLLYYLSNFI